MTEAPALNLLDAVLRVQQVYEPTADQNAALKELQRALFLLANGGRPEGIALAGEPGAGKSSTIHRLRAWAAEHWPDRPVYVVDTKAGATPKSLAADILEAAGDMFAHSGTEATRMSRVSRLIEETRPLAIVLDEFHQLFEGNTPIKTKNASQFVKTLWNANATNIILVGLSSLELFVRQSPELKRRFPCILNLSWCRIDDMAGLGDFRRLLKALEARVPLTHGVRLANDEGTTRMLVATSGSLDSVMRLTEHALFEASSQECSEVDWSHYSRALRKLGMTPESGLDSFAVEFDQVLHEAETMLHRRGSGRRRTSV